MSQFHSWNPARKRSEISKFWRKKNEKLIQWFAHARKHSHYFTLRLCQISHWLQFFFINMHSIVHMHTYFCLFVCLSVYKQVRVRLRLHYVCTYKLFTRTTRTFRIVFFPSQLYRFCFHSFIHSFTHPLTHSQFHSYSIFIV